MNIRRFHKLLLNLFRLFWPFGLFIFYLLISLSFTSVDPALLAQLLGLGVVLVAAVMWLVHDYVKDTDHRIKRELEDMADLLSPYEGMKLKEMPAEVQAEVRRRLGWSAAAVKKAAADKNKS